MTEYELNSLALQKCDIIVNIILAVLTLLLAVIALWGERLRQWWSRPKLRLSISSPNLTHNKSGRNGWFYQLHIKNKRISSPADNVEVRLTHLYFKGPDGSWQEYSFSGPVQVQWRNPEPQKRTIGPDTHATFAYLYEGDNAAHLQLYWIPYNLTEATRILPDKPVKLRFVAVSNNAKSNELTLEIAWDGKWEQVRSEMSNHFVVKESFS